MNDPRPADVEIPAETDAGLRETARRVAGARPVAPAFPGLAARVREAVERAPVPAPRSPRRTARVGLALFGLGVAALAWPLSSAPTVAPSSSPRAAVVPSTSPSATVATPAPVVAPAASPSPLAVTADERAFVEREASLLARDPEAAPLAEADVSTLSSAVEANARSLVDDACALATPGRFSGSSGAYLVTVSRLDGPGLEAALGRIPDGR